ncbi:MAG: class I SAM-dependent methyltransferase [Anaerolineae bacterium]|nr:class I SAM-dependent methyltransferase [Anaerolineae bacterium]
MTVRRGSPYEAALLPALFAVEDTHWWAAGMRRVSHALLGGVVLQPGWIAEIGCGAGAFAAELAHRHPGRDVLAVDLHPAALAVASGRRAQQEHLYIAASDGQRLPLPDESCALVVTLDVLDQARIDPLLALREIRRVLKPGGWLLLRVSAYPWLLGPHDRAFGTARRYSRVALDTTLVRGGLDPVRMTFANSLLLPVAVVARLAQRRQWLPATAGLAGVGRLNSLLARVLGGEALWLRRQNLGWGLSLYALARRAASAG